MFRFVATPRWPCARTCDFERSALFSDVSAASGPCREACPEWRSEPDPVASAMPTAMALAVAVDHCSSLLKQTPPFLRTQKKNAAKQLA